MKPLDLTNRKFWKLTALVRVENNRHGKAMWSCLCDCGNYSIVNTADLTRCKTSSCGCNRARHGMSKTRFHSIWLSMRDRCNNPNCEFYYCYGGRGIGYDKSWEFLKISTMTCTVVTRKACLLKGLMLTKDILRKIANGYRLNFKPETLEKGKQIQVVLLGCILNTLMVRST